MEEILFCNEELMEYHKSRRTLFLAREDACEAALSKLGISYNVPNLLTLEGLKQSEKLKEVNHPASTPKPRNASTLAKTAATELG